MNRTITISTLTHILERLDDDGLSKAFWAVEAIAKRKHKKKRSFYGIHKPSIKS